jgi:two-component system, chemotaxis family, protein-glutamate methylesterase/glutaminase
LPIVVVTTEQQLKPGKVYVGPPGRNVEVIGDHRPGFGRVSPTSTAAIDGLMAAAARIFADQLIGVVLSGAGLNGGSGAQAIKAYGGTVIVQSNHVLICGTPTAMPTASVDIVADLPAIGPLLVDVLTGEYALASIGEDSEHHEPIVPGRIYLAPPDRHLLVRDGVVDLNRGPRENHTRPAIDPLFRSAARAFGPRTIGVILSGALHDGSPGLLAVKGRGGTAIVQDPHGAIMSSMPRTALSLVEADHVMPARQIGPLLKRLVMESVDGDGGHAMDDEERIAGIISEDFVEQASNERSGEPTVYTCRDCGGVLWQTENNAGFFCHVGHACAAEALLVQKMKSWKAPCGRASRCCTKRRR